MTIASREIGNRWSSPPDGASSQLSESAFVDRRCHRSGFGYAQSLELVETAVSRRLMKHPRSWVTTVSTWSSQQQCSPPIAEVGGRRTRN